MRINAVVFDIGQTLVHYPIPLNWSALYRPAFEHIEQKLGLSLSEDAYEHIGKTLAKYNTRINPREKEVSSDLIFTEILEGAGIPVDLKETVKQAFYNYFRCEAHVYPEAEEALAELSARGIVTATLSDVAYGMDNQYALEDIRPLLKYIQYPYTSNDTGWRKPCGKALETLAEKTGVPVSETLFVGDEVKDVQCAKNAGAVSVLINRSGEKKDYGQDYEIRDLKEIIRLIT